MFYDYESGCLITSPDGDVASGYQINEKIEDLERKVRTLTRQNQELKDIIEKAVHEKESPRSRNWVSDFGNEKLSE